MLTTFLLLASLSAAPVKLYAISDAPWIHQQLSTAANALPDMEAALLAYGDTCRSKAQRIHAMSIEVAAVDKFVLGLAADVDAGRTQVTPQLIRRYSAIVRVTGQHLQDVTATAMACIEGEGHL